MKGLIPEIQDWWRRVDLTRLLYKIGFALSVVGVVIGLVSLFYHAGGWLAFTGVMCWFATWLEDRR